MPNQFFFEEGPFNITNDIEESFATDYFFFDQFVGSTLFSTGRNDGNGTTLGNNTIINRSTPVQEFTSNTTWSQVGSGGATSAAIRTNGTLWLWGNNSFGQLADNTTSFRSTPRQEFTSSTNWKQVSGGGFHVAAIKTDGTLWTWGRNNEGQLGDNTTITRSTPARITTATNWKQVSGGSTYTAAIKTDGTLWLWGNNGFGQLGINSILFRTTPVQEITSSTNWKQVACGGSYTAAIKTDGTLWCWGDNSFGQLGDNTLASRSTPRQELTSSTNWQQVAAGDSHTIAIKTDGTLWSWGRNSYGALGDNTTASRSTPRQEFTSSTIWKQASGGFGHTAAIKTDGTFWAWGGAAGASIYGQVGDNTNVTRSTPRQELTSSTNWKQVSCGTFHTSMIKTGIDMTTGYPA